MKWDEVLSAIDSLKALVLKVPTKQVQADFAPLLARLSDIEGAVNAKEVTPETDLTPLMDEVTCAKCLNALRKCGYRKPNKE